MGKNGVEVIIFNGIKWLDEKHIEDQLKHSNSNKLLYYTILQSLENKKRITKLWQVSAL